MYSKWRERLRHTLGFRLALWYAAIFLVSSLALTGLTYVLVAASLRQYDREIIGTTLVQYARAYQIGGVAALQEEIQRTQATAAPGPMLVRTVGARQAVTFLSRPDDWRDVDLSRLQLPSPDGQQTWSPLDPGGAPARRHAVPGRHEHRAARPVARALSPRAAVQRVLADPGRPRRGRGADS